MCETQDIFSSPLQQQLSRLLSDGQILANSIFVTLRFTKRPKPNAFRSPPDDLFLCDTSIRKNYDLFWDTLNYSLFGKKYSRSKRKTDKCQLRHLSVLHEHRNPTQTHVHSIICSPSAITKTFFIELIKTKWANTFFGKVDTGWAVDVRSIYSAGVLNYPFKDQLHFTPHTLSAYIGPDIDSARIAF